MHGMHFTCMLLVVGADRVDTQLNAITTMYSPPTASVYTRSKHGRVRGGGGGIYSAP